MPVREDGLAQQPPVDDTVVKWEIQLVVFRGQRQRGEQSMRWLSQRHGYEPHAISLGNGGIANGGLTGGEGDDERSSSGHQHRETAQRRGGLVSTGPAAADGQVEEEEEVVADVVVGGLVRGRSAGRPWWWWRGRCRAGRAGLAGLAAGLDVVTVPPVFALRLVIAAVRGNTDSEGLPRHRLLPVRERGRQFWTGGGRWTMSLAQVVRLLTVNGWKSTRGCN